MCTPRGRSPHKGHGLGELTWVPHTAEGYGVLASYSQLLAWEDLVDTATISSKHLATD